MVVTNENNIYESALGTFRAFCEGHVLILEPLPPGMHEIDFTVSVHNPIDLNYNYATKSTYLIKVTN